MDSTSRNGSSSFSPSPIPNFPIVVPTNQNNSNKSAPGPGRMNLKLCELERENAELKAEIAELKEWRVYVEKFLTEHLGYPDMEDLNSASEEIEPKPQIQNHVNGNGPSKNKEKPESSSQNRLNTSIPSTSSSSYHTPQPHEAVQKAQSRKSEPNRKKQLQSELDGTKSVPTSNKLPTKRKIEDFMDDQNGEPSNKKSKPRSDSLNKTASALGLKLVTHKTSTKDSQIAMKREGVTPSSSRPAGVESARSSNKSNFGLENDEDKDLDQTPCNICYSHVPEYDNKMLFCDTCNVCVHQACYGVKEIPKGDWKCKTCSVGIPKDSATCRLCTVKGGAMIKVNAPGKNSWAHVSCTWWIPEVNIKTPEEMDLVIGLPKIDKRRWNLKCYLCGEGKGTTCCIQCAYKKCCKAYHVTCAFNYGLTMDIIDQEGDQAPKFYSWCPAHCNDDSRSTIFTKTKNQKSK